jgi:hypothetical protein
VGADRFPAFGHIGVTASFRTEPALRSGAEFQQKSTLLVGQRVPDPDPRAAMFLGKVAEQTASRNLFNWAVWLDATFPHVMLIAGKRGSGKSYDLGILAEGLCAPDSQVAFGTTDFAMILFDTQNQFWTLTLPTAGLSAEERSLLAAWRIELVSLASVTIYRPQGTQSIGDFEHPFSIRPADLEPQDWTALLGVDRYSAIGQAVRAARSAMSGSFDILDMVEWLRTEDAAQRFAGATLDAVAWRLDAFSGSGLFDAEAGDLVAQLATKASKAVIQLADLDDDTKAVVVAVILRQLIARAGPEQRRRKLASRIGGDLHETDVAPRIWVLIDEAHLVCPADRQTAARPVIVDYVKRGRDSGLSLVMATQQPSALDTAAISQSDIVAIHKLTIDLDIDAATARMPARPPASTTRLSRSADVSKMYDLARSLESGQSVFADAESNRAFILQSRPRLAPHGGGEPEL